MKIYIETTSPEIELPAYAHDGDAGMDVRANEDVLIAPGQTVVVKTGLKVAIPRGYELQVRPRSGMSLKTQLRVANTPGTIDSGYRDEIGVIVTNASFPFTVGEDGNVRKTDLCLNANEEKQARHGSYFIHKGDRIAQIVLKKFENIEFKPCDCVKEIGTDRNGGFGSSGVM